MGMCEHKADTYNTPIWFLKMIREKYIKCFISGYLDCHRSYFFTFFCYIIFIFLLSFNFIKTMKYNINEVKNYLVDFTIWIFQKDLKNNPWLFNSL